MNKRIERRLEHLVSEQRQGRQALAELDLERSRIADTLLRIEGAMAVLRELLADVPNERDNKNTDLNPSRKPLRDAPPEPTQS